MFCGNESNDQGDTKRLIITQPDVFDLISNISIIQ
jgi:hypothetical protein